MLSKWGHRAFFVLKIKLIRNFLLNKKIISKIKVGFRLATP